MRGGALFKGKEGQGDFRKILLLSKDFANECNESSLSNCRVQLALSKKRDGVIFEDLLLGCPVCRTKNALD